MATWLRLTDIEDGEPRPCLTRQSRILAVWGEDGAPTKLDIQGEEDQLIVRESVDDLMLMLTSVDKVVELRDDGSAVTWPQPAAAPEVEF